MSGIAFDLAIAILLGSALGMGLWAMLACLPRWAVTPLTMRIAPYLRDVTEPRGITIRMGFTDPVTALVHGVDGGVRRVRDRAITLLGSAEATQIRLSRAGIDISVETYRGRQLGFAIAAGGVGAVIALIAVSVGRPAALSWLLPIALAVAGFIGADRWVAWRAAKRRDRIRDELPTVLEFLALCLSAGEGIGDAIRRTGGVGSGELARELKRVSFEVSTGSSLTDALAACAERLDVSAVRRAVDHLSAAIERGSPLASVLRDQASDARGDQHRALLERAGKKEIAMLFPLVFLILPLSVLIAVFPGIQLIRLG